MIQFNLLPEVKREYVRTERNKRFILLSTAVASSLSVLILVVLFVTISVLQKSHSNRLTARISEESNKLTGNTDLNKILTIQNQLASLPALYDQRPAAIRLVPYLKQVTPADTTISSVSIDFEAGTLTLGGNAKSLTSLNTFVDTLKFTTFQTTTTKDIKAFSEVVLGSYSKSTDSTSYQLNMKFDKTLFIATQDVKLIIPESKITTRSETEKPDAIFDENKTEEGTQ